ncbi:glycosyltransferase family 2 protein [Natronosporangium hydrolyticum]|uniref:Glycosyltransferase family 2 protein n=1 Tax=Natronosporangium hydrolyticum TaxID=2811111 RepID=A0A895YCI3_9ACTN|nr:glycosyltransferase family 2 protein [Natronosporangium hydrolyticum]QSB15201.1 glycosyltransferase family 2 protein [Natronosporangium hydrolyticum]
MSALVVGLAVLLIWPLFNAVLAGYATTTAAAAGRHARRGRRPPEFPAGQRAHPVSYWIVIPCLNEERVVARTVAAALALPAPGARVEVLVVDDGSDDGTPAVLAGIGHERLHVLRREPPVARQGKGAALNAAYQLIRQRVAEAGTDPTRVAVGVIDGDGRGTDNLLVEVGDALREPAVGAVQVRVRIHNRDRLLGMAQDLEFGSVADASQVLRDRVGSVGLGGNGQFIRLSALLALGDQPWSGCLVEDLELGLRLHLARVRVRYVWRAAVVQQAVVDARRLLRQRTRWAQGNLQCLPYLGRLFGARQIPNHTFVEMAYYLLAPWFNALGAIVVGGFWTVTTIRAANGGAVLSGGVVLGIVVAIWLSVMVLPGLLWAVLHRFRLRDEALSRCLLGGLVYPALLLLGLVSTWRAVARQVSGRRGWAKTERIPEAVPELT